MYLRIGFLSISLAFSSFLLNAQSVSSQINGAVTDPQGAVVPAADILVVGSETNARFTTKANDRGEWTVPSLPTATYRVTVTAAGFQTANVENIRLEPGKPATVNVTLTVGNISDRIEVTAGAEILQTTDSSVTTNLEGRQINQLPMTARNATELLVLLPGTSTPGTSRTSSINGLPKGSLAMSLDGISIQDNYLKSSDGFFATIQPKPDAIEEVAVTTAGGSADVLGAGSAQVRFVTKSGTNKFHGTAFWQTRNTDLDANYYFNTINAQPRDRLILNQFGGSIGGPIKKDKLFFFWNQEFFRLPQSYTPASLLTIPTQSAINGIYTYADANKVLHQVDVLQLAAANPAPAGSRAFATTPDPNMQTTLQDMLKLASAGGTLNSRVAKASDYNRYDYTFTTNGMNRRSFPTVKLDWNATSKHHADVVINYQKYYANPDAVNGILPILAGTGTVLGSPASGGTRRISFSGVTSLRSSWTPRLTSEVRFGLEGGNSIFRDEITPALYSRWNGYAPVFTGTYFSNPYTTASNSRRNSPVKQFATNLTWTAGAHVVNFGGNFDQINLWQQSNGTQVVPTITMGIATGDPVANIFTLATLPGSTSTQRTEAQQLYAILTGRVSAISRSLSLDETTKKYSNTGSIDRDRQREFAFYVQDSWRVRRNLTLNAGVRWDVQLPFVNLDGLYSTAGYQGAWGISGVGNLFQPGNTPGSANIGFNAAKPDQYAYNANYRIFLPSAGFAYTLPEAPGFLRRLTGKEGQTVVRGGYAISVNREGTGVFTGLWGSNPGRSTSTSVDPSNTPAAFGAPGSVYFRDATLPSASISTTPVYPIPLAANISINEIDPKIRQAYVQNWVFSLQREILKDTVLDVRYVGNHAVGLWRQLNLNEINIFENGFLKEFQVAQNNLRIAQNANPASINFGNQGLPGQANVPILLTALGTTSDSTQAVNIQQGQAGAVASAIALNATRMASLVKAGYPANMFVANPATNSGAFFLTNGGGATYNSLQTEVRRRLSQGLLTQASYTWGKSLTNMDASSSSVFSQPITFRDSKLDKGPSPWDIRHSFKMSYIYELPFGPGRKWMTGGNSFVKKAVQGWEFTGNYRLQSGSPALLRSGRQTFNTASGQSSTADAGIVLHGLTAQQLNDMVAIRKDPAGIIYYLPQALLNNTNAAFEVGGKTLANLDPNAPYIGPPTTAGQLGQRIYLYGPWQSRVDFGILKRTPVAEKASLEFRATALNLFNDVNFLLGSAGNDVNSLSAASAQFGQTTSAYRDITVSGANDPGGRIVEFQLRLVF